MVAAHRVELDRVASPDGEVVQSVDGHRRRWPRRTAVIGARVIQGSRAIHGDPAGFGSVEHPRRIAKLAGGRHAASCATDAVICRIASARMSSSKPSPAGSRTGVVFGPRTRSVRRRCHID
jgi:hypothetical protein